MIGNQRRIGKARMRNVVLVGVVAGLGLAGDFVFHLEQYEEAGEHGILLLAHSVSGTQSLPALGDPCARSR